MADLVGSTVRAIRAAIPDLGDAKLGTEYYYQSLPLCVIDAVFSIGVRYASAQNAVLAWCNSQRPAWVKDRTHGQKRYTNSDLIRVLDGLSGSESTARYFGGNRHRTSSKNGILKSDAVFLFAQCLVAARIEDFEDINDKTKVARARSAVEQIPGQCSGKSFDYFMMMAGEDDFVKADRMICRFVAAAAGLPAVSEHQAQEAIKGACKVLRATYPQLTPRLLDHIVWLHQRKA